MEGSGLIFTTWGPSNTCQNLDVGFYFSPPSEKQLPPAGYPMFFVGLLLVSKRYFYGVSAAVFEACTPMYCGRNDNSAKEVVHVRRELLYEICKGKGIKVGLVNALRQVRRIGVALILCLEPGAPMEGAASAVP